MFEKFVDVIFSLERKTCAFHSFFLWTYCRWTLWRVSIEAKSSACDVVVAVWDGDNGEPFPLLTRMGVLASAFYLAILWSSNKLKSFSSMTVPKLRRI